MSIDGLLSEGGVGEMTSKHKGVEIVGLNFLNEAGILTEGDVTTLLDKLPAKYFEKVPLGVVRFEPYKLFSVVRGEQVKYVQDVDKLETDIVIARKRGVTSWNSKIVESIAVPTDGKMTISIFSPLNWDEQENRQLDKDTALYTLAHELGHTIWGAPVYIPGIFGELQRLGIQLPCSQDATKLLPLLEKWKKLPGSKMQRYLDYQRIFSKEHESESQGHLKSTLDDLSHEEDFAISHESFLYWNNLDTIDSQRNEQLQEIFAELAK